LVAWPWHIALAQMRCARAVAGPGALRDEQKLVRPHFLSSLPVRFALSLQSLPEPLTTAMFSQVGLSDQNANVMALMCHRNRFEVPCVESATGAQTIASAACEH
jgi:hypothetical protein